MIPNVPALSDALDDHRLRPIDLKVLLILARELDVLDWRPVKEAALRHAMHIGRTRLYEALRVLVSRGYVERQGGGPGEVAAYRLVYTVRHGERTDAA